MDKKPTSPSFEENTPASVQQSRLAWQKLGWRIRSITPTSLARGLLVLGMLTFLTWLLIKSWANLLPFQIGVILAYIALPLVNRLDRIFPRGFVILLVILGEIILVVAFIFVMIPALAEQIRQLLTILPDLEQIRAALQRLVISFRSLPTGVQVFFREGLSNSLDNIQGNFVRSMLQLLTTIGRATLQVIGTISFLLGMLVIPTWVFAVLYDQQRGARLLNSVLPRETRPDFWAVITIINRTLSTYLQGKLLVGFIVGLLTYLGFAILNRLGITQIGNGLLLAIFAGVMRLIPNFGFLLGLLPGILVGALSSRETFAVIVILYITIDRLVAWFVEPHIEERSADLHPAVTALLLVIASQFGLIWVFLAAPLAAIGRDLFKYFYGRLSSPPRPAGVLPDGEKVKLTYEPAPSFQRRSRKQPQP
jgi:predicted PurR-regulated permease PerM